MTETPQVEQTEQEGKSLDTGVLIFHLPTNTKCRITAWVRKGTGQVTVNGVSITKLLEEGKVQRFEELLQTLHRERFKSVDVELTIESPQWTEILSPPVLAYAINEALTNLLGRL